MSNADAGNYETVMSNVDEGNYETVMSNADAGNYETVMSNVPEVQCEVPVEQNKTEIPVIAQTETVEKKEVPVTKVPKPQLWYAKKSNDKIQVKIRRIDLEPKVKQKEKASNSLWYGKKK